jgi:hypothetical protein
MNSDPIVSTLYTPQCSTTASNSSIVLDSATSDAGVARSLSFRSSTSPDAETVVVMTSANATCARDGIAALWPREARGAMYRRFLGDRHDAPTTLQVSHECLRDHWVQLVSAPQRQRAKVHNTMR